MTIIFYRILGNDIPIRHRAHQTLTNLPFILRNESALPDCEKRFLLNRIVDAQVRRSLITAIEAAGLRWDEIAFDPAEFRALPTHEDKALYLTNQNAARNRCVDLGLADADVVLPFDGQVFFRREGWAAMMRGLQADPDAHYLTVPMLRVRENHHATGAWNGSEDADHLWAEPQIAVRRGYDLRFNEQLSYGNANKIELLMKLGVKGPWDTWDSPVYRTIRTQIAAAPSPNFGRVRQAGFVFRLASGNWKAERSTSIRVHSRRLGLEEFVLRIAREHAA
ncbi:MAG TPA: hypothetical protein VF132_14355 [Rudaea sp.]